MNNILKLMASAGFVLLLGFTVLGNMANASTPSGATPANEGVCNVLIGATPGLYGLCVAYCEAQDLNDTDKTPPNTRILTNYNNKKQAGDPDMPCVRTPCPCWNEDEMVTAATSGSALCNSSPESGTLYAQGLISEIDTTGSPKCIYIDFNNRIRRINGDISADEVASCYSTMVSACTSIGQ